MNKQFIGTINKKYQKVNYNLHNGDVQLENTVKTSPIFK